MQRNRLNLVTDPWRIVEADFDPARVEAAESLFALGNGVMGGRANFEERYSGPSLTDSTVTPSSRSRPSIESGTSK